MEKRELTIHHRVCDTVNCEDHDEAWIWEKNWLASSLPIAGGGVCVD